VATWGYGLMADTYIQEKNYAKATTYLEKAIKVAEAIKKVLHCLKVYHEFIRLSIRV